jgi:predicted hydrolase (HD superfamily)
MVVEELLFEHRTHTRGIAIPMAIHCQILLVRYYNLAQIHATLFAPDLASGRVFAIPIVKGDREHSLVELHFLTDVLFADFHDNNTSCTHIFVVFIV